jgi:hypothetical protein
MLKAERETLDGRRSAAEVRQAVCLYIEAYYNRVRLLDYARRWRYSLFATWEGGIVASFADQRITNRKVESPTSLI